MRVVAIHYMRCCGIVLMCYQRKSITKVKEMRTEFEKIQLVNKAIAEDEQIIVLYKEKHKLLNHLTPKYIWNKETKTMTGYFD